LAYGLAAALPRALVRWRTEASRPNPDNHQLRNEQLAPMPQPATPNMTARFTRSMQPAGRAPPPGIHKTISCLLRRRSESHRQADCGHRTFA
jgi:hypothetical protein